MIRLRDFLREMDPELHQRLEGAWEIGRDEWIPALNTEGESHAGLPHLEAVEGWMDRVADYCSPAWKRHSDVPFGFNAVELYIALCAALFHDVGRGRTDPDKDHGQLSKMIISESWAQLGILSARIAHELENIAEFHTSKVPWHHADVVKIHPWGIVHSEAIACLLTLADELDTAYTRGTPQYIRDPALDLSRAKAISVQDMERYTSKGVMRDFVSSVDLDPSSHLIKTVLFPDTMPESIEGNHAAVWRGTVCASGVPTDRFDVEGYFYAYLESLRGSTSSQVLDFLADQYHKNDQRDLMKLIREFRFPNDFPTTEMVLYQLMPGDRQLPRRENDALRQARNESESLRKTANLIETAIKYHSRHVPESKFRFQLDGRSSQLCANVFTSVRAFHARAIAARRLLAQESRIEESKFLEQMEKCCNADFRTSGDSDNDPDAIKEVRKALGSGKPEDAGWDMEDEDKIRFYKAIDSDPAPGRLDGTFSAEQAHFLLIRLLYILLDVDIEKSSTKSIVTRRWESWPVNEYHRNLMFAFQIYLANVRRLWHSIEYLDLRSSVPGLLEKDYWMVHGQQPELVTGLQNVFDPLSTFQSSSELTSEEGMTEKLKNALKNFADSVAESYHGQKMDASEFQYAIRLIFMRWMTGDLAQKNKALKRIRSGLQRLEIPFDEWLLEYNNHLFDAQWRLRVEPSLSRGFVKSVAENAVRLRKNLFVRNDWIPWEALAAAVGEPDIERVQTGARRLSALCTIQRRLGEDAKQSGEDGKKNMFAHFGHFMKADLKSSATSNEKGLKLETSASSWRLEKVPSSGEKCPRLDEAGNDLLGFLKHIAEDGAGK